MPREPLPAVPEPRGTRTEYGEIIAIKDGIAHIRVDPSAECSACTLQGHCHSEPDKYPVLHWPAPPEAAEGQTVAIRVTKTSRLRLAMLVYLLPLITATAGALLAEHYGNPAWADYNGMLGFFAGLAAAAAIILPVAKLGTRKGKWTLELAPVAGAGESASPP